VRARERWLVVVGCGLVDVQRRQQRQIAPLHKTKERRCPTNPSPSLHQQLLLLRSPSATRATG
jgi:hypothetical protein